MKVILLTSLLLCVTPLYVLAEPLHLIDKNEVLETVHTEQYALNLIDEIFIDEKKMEFLIDYLNPLVYSEPQNAMLDKYGTIVPEKPGFKLDRQNFIYSFQRVFYNGKQNRITIPKKIVFPKVDSELLAEIKTNEISHYSTFFKKGNKERSTNIEIATKAINNHVVFPGEKFSFNSVVGKRTEEKGYQRAPVIVKGELSEDIGGGICQVSSTLYNAVDLPGIEMVERYSHSRSVPYVPPGRDATVSWYGPDFTFINKYSHPILIRATSENGRMFIRIFSSESVESKPN
ncbi:VanW family protein [Virgibacillus byunsanensis]|uniref:VanW family protein n=1 Tax=Virgibacillus byunsanensis TaxID=570945 RepID=A0ABW3LPN5_9BACI